MDTYLSKKGHLPLIFRPVKVTITWKLCSKSAWFKLCFTSEGTESIQRVVKGTFRGTFQPKFPPPACYPSLYAISYNPLREASQCIA